MELSLSESVSESISSSGWIVVSVATSSEVSELISVSDCSRTSSEAADVVAVVFIFVDSLTSAD